jgi:hypothetical protein
VARTVPLPDVRAPDATYVRARWLAEHEVDWAKYAAEIIREHGSVVSDRSYNSRSGARWHAQSLIRMLVELRMYRRGELVEHSNRQRDGRFTWAVEARPPEQEG